LRRETRTDPPRKLRIQLQPALNALAPPTQGINAVPIFDLRRLDVCVVPDAATHHRLKITHPRKQFAIAFTRISELSLNSFQVFKDEVLGAFGHDRLCSRDDAL
jgi:hypothetical protein